MSTDIVHWKSGQRDFQVEALTVYLYLSLPFMLLTFATWAIFQVNEKRKERRKKEQIDEDLSRPSV